MRKLFSGLLLGVALTFAGSVASALPYTGTVVLVVGTLSPVFIGGAGTGNPALPSISAGTFVGTGSSAVTGVAPITQIFLTVTGNGAGPVGSGPNFQAALQARGFAGVPLISATLANRVGYASVMLVQSHTGGTGILTAHFAPWTQGLATVLRTTKPQHSGGSGVTYTPCTGNVTAMTGDYGTAGQCQTAALGGATANAAFFGGAAQIVLVSPTDLYTTTAGIGGLPTFTVMALNYVPEPGTLLLLGAGVAGLAFVGRKRMS